MRKLFTALAGLILAFATVAPAHATSATSFDLSAVTLPEGLSWINSNGEPVTDLQHAYPLRTTDYDSGGQETWPCDFTLLNSSTATIHAEFNFEVAVGSNAPSRSDSSQRPWGGSAVSIEPGSSNGNCLGGITGNITTNTTVTVTGSVDSVAAPSTFNITSLKNQLKTFGITALAVQVERPNANNVVQAYMTYKSKKKVSIYMPHVTVAAANSDATWTLTPYDSSQVVDISKDGDNAIDLGSVTLNDLSARFDRGMSLTLSATVETVTPAALVMSQSATLPSGVTAVIQPTSLWFDSEQNATSFTLGFKNSNSTEKRLVLHNFQVGITTFSGDYYVTIPGKQTVFTQIAPNAYNQSVPGRCTSNCTMTIGGTGTVSEIGSTVFDISGITLPSGWTARISHQEIQYDSNSGYSDIYLRIYNAKNKAKYPAANSEDIESATPLNGLDIYPSDLSGSANSYSELSPKNVVLLRIGRYLGNAHLLTEPVELSGVISTFKTRMFQDKRTVTEEVRNYTWIDNPIYWGYNTFTGQTQVRLNIASDPNGTYRYTLSKLVVDGVKISGTKTFTKTYDGDWSKAVTIATLSGDRRVESGKFKADFTISYTLIRTLVQAAPPQP